MKRHLALAVLAMAPLICAQTLKLSIFDKLKEKASDATNLNLSKDLLGLGAGFLGNEKDAAKIKKLAQGLDSILIRTLEFDKEGAYSNGDLQQLMAELGSPGWNLVMSADETKSHEVSRIWIKREGNGELGGLRVMSAEPRELSVIEITGKIRLEDLKDLTTFGVPDVLSEHGQPAKKNDD
jgi:hypothetical protein